MASKGTWRPLGAAEDHPMAKEEAARRGLLRRANRNFKAAADFDRMAENRESVGYDEGAAGSRAAAESMRTRGVRLIKRARDGY